MARPNYQFEKRQRDLAKAKKREEKAQRQRARTEARLETRPETSENTAPPSTEQE